MQYVHVLRYCSSCMYVRARMRDAIPTTSLEEEGERATLIVLRKMGDRCV